MTSYVNKSDSTIMLNITFFPKKLCFAKGYAPIEANTTCKAVQNTVIHTLLNKYLENGTHKLEVILKSCLKLLRVGLFTQNLGGNINNSSNGFNACKTVYTKGIAITVPSSSKKINIPAVPIFDLLTCFELNITGFPPKIRQAYVAFDQSLFMMIETIFLVMIMVMNNTVASAHAYPISILIVPVSRM